MNKGMVRQLVLFQILWKIWCHILVTFSHQNYSLENNQVFQYAKHFCFQWRKTKEDNDTKVGIFYAELLTRKVILWVFIFSSETSERKNPPFNIWNQNLRLRHNFFIWKSNQYETYYIFTQNLEKISTSHVMGSCA